MLFSRSMHPLDKLHLTLDRIGDLAVPSSIAVGALFYVLHALIVGVAPIRPDLRFARDDEPREYWALVALSLTGFALSIPWVWRVTISPLLQQFI